MIQVLERLLNALLVQWERLNYWLDLVYGGELHHLIMDRSRCYNGPLNAKAAHQQRHIWELEVASRDGQGKDGSSRRQYGGIQGIVWLCAGGYEEVIERLDVLELLWRFDALHGVKFHGTQLCSFLFLAVCAAKDHHLATHVGRKLNSKMP